MRKMLSFILALIAVLLIAALGFSKFSKTKNKSDDRVFEATREKLARGQYLANHVAICMDCHSHRDWSYFSAPIIPGSEGMGGDRFGPEWGLPGTLYPKNITPKGIGHWTDAELIKALTQGVNKDGETLFPLMPYMAYRQLSQDDLFSVIAYVRSLKPIENQIPARELFVPIEAVMPSTPPPVTPQGNPDKKNTIEYGKYLTTIAACSDCHTPMENGQFVAEMAFGGGYPFQLPNGQTVISQNITPDMETGIGKWDRETFIAVFKAYSDKEIRQTPLGKDDHQTIMPWSLYSGMTEEDLGAIYDYLRTVTAVKNKVDRFVSHGI